MIEDERIEPRRGVYDTHRASALTGVPYQTLHYWARERIYLPSINPEPRTRLWSWGDLLALRAIYWFRHRDEGQDEEKQPHVPMSKIRELLATIETVGESRENLTRLVAVDDAGDLYLRLFNGRNGGDRRLLSPDVDFTYIRADRSRQVAMPEMMNLVMPFRGAPDLLKPRELVRIIPGKLHGEPHVVDTRVSTAVLYRFAEMGYSNADIREMYPSVSGRALRQALGVWVTGEDWSVTWRLG